MNISAASHAAEQAGPATRAGLRVLVADDDRASREVYADALIGHGYDVDAAEDGAAAWQALNAHSYDLLITNDQMPRMTGVELLKRLRARRMEMPVIMASVSLPEREFRRYPWLQPAATLLKPFTPVELLVKVREVLRATGNSQAEAMRSPPWRSRPPAGVLPP
jgi:two-component system OmpR family response regulator